MNIEILSNGVWYHGSNLAFDELRTGSTITQWRELAEAFSHQPSSLWYDDNGVIRHIVIEMEGKRCKQSILFITSIRGLIPGKT